jgi:uncharacterized protein YndB with AHSA1/START domain
MVPTMKAEADHSVELRELRLERVFDAPRPRVFRALTDPAQLAQWWGPLGFTNPVCEMDARPGGAITIHMRSPEGTTYPLHGEVREIATPERLVFTLALRESDGSIRIGNTTIITLAEQGAKTRLSLHVRITDLNAAGEAAIKGMREGWSQSLDRLGGLVARR